MCICQGLREGESAKSFVSTSSLTTGIAYWRALAAFPLSGPGSAETTSLVDFVIPPDTNPAEMISLTDSERPFTIEPVNTTPVSAFQGKAGRGLRRCLGGGPLQRSFYL